MKSLQITIRQLFQLSQIETIVAHKLHTLWLFKEMNSNKAVLQWKPDLFILFHIIKTLILIKLIATTSQKQLKTFILNSTFFTYT